MNSSTKKTDRLGIVVWTLFAGLLVYGGITKYGALLVYLNVSSYLSLSLVVLITYKLSEKLDEKIRTQTQTSYATLKRVRFIKSVLTYGVFAALCYFFFFVQPDKLAIAYFKEIPIEALSPCSHMPLKPEVEKISRDIFKLKDIDSFECSSGYDRLSPAEGW